MPKRKPAASVDNAGKIAALKQRPRDPSTRRQALTEAEGLAVIAAYRRRVPIAEIAKAAGLSRANVYASLGSWALHFCRCAEHSK